MRQEVICNHCHKPITDSSEFLLGKNMQVYLGKGKSGLFLGFINDTPYHKKCYAEEAAQVDEEMRVHKHLKMDYVSRALAFSGWDPMNSPIGIVNHWTMLILLFGFLIILFSPITGPVELFFSLGGFLFAVMVKLRAFLKYETKVR